MKSENYKRYTTEQVLKAQELIKPLYELIDEIGNPHTTIIISNDSFRIVEDTWGAPR